MKIIKCLQYDAVYWAARAGVPSASRFDRILTPGGKVSAQQDDLICELIAEKAQPEAPFFSTRGTGRPMTDEMREGLDREGESRHRYAMEVNSPVVQVGFCMSDCGRLGCSPDALVGDDGVLELKNPTLKTQAGYLLKGVLPADYRPQCHGHLIVTGRAWVDFFSYCPGLPPFIVRVEPDEFTEKLRQELERFLAKYLDAAKRLGVMLGASEPAEVEPAF